jgi:hypothetical protein
MAAAPQSRARPLRLRLPARRAALHRLRHNRPPSDPELAGAVPVLGALEPGRRLPRCNYGDGSRVASDNRRQQIAYLQQLADEQQQQINRLLEKVARYENGESAKPRAPAVY